MFSHDEAEATALKSGFH